VVEVEVVVGNRDTHPAVEEEGNWDNRPAGEAVDNPGNHLVAEGEDSQDSHLEAEGEDSQDSHLEAVAEANLDRLPRPPVEVVLLVATQPVACEQSHPHLPLPHR